MCDSTHSLTQRRPPPCLFTHSDLGQTRAVCPHIPRQTVTEWEVMCVTLDSLSLPGCLQWTEKRGHSVQWSDDWAADTGKKEADRERNKERERCRSLPNCQWVTTVEHTCTDTTHRQIKCAHTPLAYQWICKLNACLCKAFNLYFFIPVCVCARACVLGWGIRSSTRLNFWTPWTCSEPQRGVQHPLALPLYDELDCIRVMSQWHRHIIALG